MQRQAAARELADHEKLVKEPTRVVAHDITPEMAKQMIVQQGGAMAIVEAEGTFFSIIAGRYTDGKKSPPIEVMLTGHAGEPVTVDRKAGPALYTPRGHLTIAVACQPKVAEAMGAVDGFRDRGGAARILPAFPTSTVGYRSITALAIPDALRGAWVATVRAILNHTPVRPADSGGYLMYCELHLAPDAYATFQAFRRWHEPQLKRGGSMGDFADWGSKLPGAVLRIAGLVHVATHDAPEHVRISADTINRAVTLAGYFTEHARIMYRVMAGRSGMSEARQVWEAIQALPEPTTKRDVHRKLQDRAAFHKADTLTEPLAILEEFGWLRLERAGKSTTVTRNPLTKTPDSPDDAPTVHATSPPLSALSVVRLHDIAAPTVVAPTGTDGALPGEILL